MTPLQNAQETCADYMERIVKLFKPGAKITVIVRTPYHPDRDFVMTDDNITDAIDALTRRKAAPSDAQETI
jgi:pyoverdine/dityrosine biosynthesis protein Dit1